MRYLGSKEQAADRIAAYLESVRPPGAFYWEPFVGGAAVLARMSGARGASDLHPALITTYRAYQSGWRPPDFVSEDTYNAYKANPDPADPLTAFIGFGCTLSGTWFGGYIRSRERQREPIKRSATLINMKIGKCEGVLFAHMDYREAAPVGCLVYADPPYANAAPYKGLPKWDPAAFFGWCRVASRENVVIVSEYAENMPPDFEQVAEFEKRADQLGPFASKATTNRSERLFRVRA